MRLDQPPVHAPHATSPPLPLPPLPLPPLPLPPLPLLPPASRTVHWAGNVRRTGERIGVNVGRTGERIDVAAAARAGCPPSCPSPPASHTHFSFAAAVREHLSFGPHVLAQLLGGEAESEGQAEEEGKMEEASRRSEGDGGGGWASTCLETQKILCFGWDRTSDARGWPEGQARFFMYERYRTQDLTRRPDLAALVPSDPDLILTEGIRQLATRLLDCYKHAQPVLIEGDAAGGKTAAVAFCAHRTNSPLLRFNMTPTTTIADFVGQLGLGAVPSARSFGFVLGPLGEAVKDGLWLLVDEANLAPDTVLRVMEDVLSTGYLRLGSGGVAGQPGATSGQLTLPAHPNFRLLLTQNSASDVSYGSTRHLLSPSLLSHFVPVMAPQMEPAQMHHILAAKLARGLDGAAAINGQSSSSSSSSSSSRRRRRKVDDGGEVSAEWHLSSEWPRACAAALLKLHAATNEAAKAERLRTSATLRDLLQAVDLLRMARDQLHRRLAIVEGLKAIFTQRLRRTSSIACVRRLVDAHESVFLPFGGGHLLSAVLSEPTATTEPSAAADDGDDDDDEDGASGRPAVLFEHSHLFAMLDVSAATRKPTLVCGPDMCGKASAAIAWARSRGRACVVRVLTPETTAEELFGQIVPSSAEIVPSSAEIVPSSAEAAVREEGAVVSAASATIAPPPPPPPPYHWEPGPVTRAMERGCVLLLRGIDAPDPAVLEALNAVLEVDASTRRSALVAGRTVQVAEGFYVICTSRESQHALTPALASRFLAVAWGDEAEGAGDKLVGQLSFEALVLHYTRAAAGGVAAVAAREAISTALGARYQPPEATRQTVGEVCMVPEATRPTFRLGEMCMVLRAIGRWWSFMSSHERLRTAAAARAPHAAAALASLLGGQRPTDPAELPITLADLRPELTCADVSEATGFTFTLSHRSRHTALHVVLSCIHCGVPLILQGVAGVGKTRLVEVAYGLLEPNGRQRPSRVPTVQFSRSTTLQDLVGQWRPQGGCEWVDGPLYWAMRGGLPLLCDEMNLASSDVVAFLVPLLDGPPVFECPLGGGTVRVQPGFVIIVAQNPPHYAGRSALPRAFVRRALCYEVHPYCEAEVLAILRRHVRARHGVAVAEATWLTPRLMHATHVLGYTDAALATAPSDAVTLRHVLKLLGRLLDEGAWASVGCEDATDWREVIQLHACILFPQHVPDEVQIPKLHASLTLVEAPTAAELQRTATVEAVGSNAAANGASDGDVTTAIVGLRGVAPLPHAQVTLRLWRASPLVRDFEYLPEGARLLVAQLAFCIAFREPVLLSGPSCYKSHCARLLGQSLVLPRAKEPISTLFLSALTEAADLEGGVEPHTFASYIAYLQPCVRDLQAHASSGPLAPGAPPPPALDAADDLSDDL